MSLMFIEYSDDLDDYLNGKHIPSPDQNHALLTLTSQEVERLYQLLKETLVWDALHKPRKENYTDELYDKIADLKGDVHNSHDEYEYWYDWKEKNREDLYEDRCEREDEE